ncbi:MAG: DNA-binding protein [Alphaproteobacteria bacterium]|jgi:gp16 family phage-associated protein|nr:DNA-binding protein [Alphaproteobacteria bacterium]
MKPLTPTQVKERFRRRGETMKSWADAHGYPLREVYKVLNGQSKAYFGQGHEIAVKLGLKCPEDQQQVAA